MATFNLSIYVDKSIMLINTANDSNAIVLLSNSTNVGDIYTVKDSGGFASSTSPIFISTITTSSFLDSTTSNYQIQQPFGYMSFISINSTQWAILNTFANNTGSGNTQSYIETPQVSSIIFSDSATIGTAPILNVSNGILQLNGDFIQGIMNDTHNNIITTEPLILSNIYAKHLTVGAPVQSKSQFIAIGNSNNINISYDGITWTNSDTILNNYTGMFLTIKDSSVIGLFMSNSLDNYTISIQSTTDGNTWSEISFLSYTYGGINTNIKLKYTSKYYIITYRQSAYLSTNLTNWDYIYSSYIFDTDGTIFLMYNTGVNKLAVVGDDPVTGFFNSGSTVNINMVNANVIINTIKYIPISNKFMVVGQEIRNNLIYTYLATYNSNAQSITISPNCIVQDDSLTTFTTNDVYINQGTSLEIGLPSVVYFGMHNGNNNNNIAYTYSSNIAYQSNFNYIHNIPSQIYTYTMKDGKFYVGGLSNTVIILASSNFIDPINNPYTSYTTTLTSINSIISTNFMSPDLNTETLFNVSGNIQTNFLKLKLQDSTESVIYDSPNGLNINNMFMNLINGYLEIKSAFYETEHVHIYTTYPLSSHTPDIGGMFIVENDIAWMKRDITGLILNPGYYAIIYENPNYEGNYSQTVNTDSYPIYINLGAIRMQLLITDTQFSCVILPNSV